MASSNGIRYTASNCPSPPQIAAVSPKLWQPSLRHTSETSSTGTGCQLWLASRAGVLWSAVAGRIESLVREAGFSVVTEYVGHGIGSRMWEEPRVPNYVGADMLRDDFLLIENMTFAVEPMVNMGRKDVRETDDGWTVVTCDGQPSAHFEDTFLVTGQGAEPLTRWQGQH